MKCKGCGEMIDVEYQEAYVGWCAVVSCRCLFEYDSAATKETAKQRAFREYNKAKRARADAGEGEG